jgi:hypothetical protein
MKRLPSPERLDSSERLLSSENPTSSERPPLVDATEKAKNRLENYRTFARVARMKGFQVPAESDVVSDEALVGSVTMRLPTVRGQFALTFFQNRDETGWKTAWIENGTKRFERTWVRKDDGTEIFSQNDLERRFSSRIDQCVLSAMVAREKAKQRDFREIEKVEVGSDDLKAIYRRLEEPWVRNSGNETGGFWFASPYLAHDGTFPLRNLELPLKEQESATPVSHEIWDLSFFQNAYRKRMLSDFSDYERSLALKFAKRAKVTESGHPLLGFCRTFNWHKHPGAPLSPSDGDLNHPGAEPSAMYSGTALATFYAIANRVGQNDAVRSWTNALTLPHGKYGGMSDYVITFWKVLKILPEERKRREAAIEKIGKIRGISLGLCETDGKLKHLSTCAEVPGIGAF